MRLVERSVLQEMGNHLAKGFCCDGWIAMAKDGLWYYFTGKPVICEVQGNDELWRDKGHMYQMLFPWNGIEMSDNGKKVNWYKTLIEVKEG